MIRIRLLLSGLMVFSGGVLVESAVAGNELEHKEAKLLWPCGASLLPCRLPGETAVPSLPYWRAHLPDRPIRASHTPVFPNRKTRK